VISLSAKTIRHSIVDLYGQKSDFQSTSEHTQRHPNPGPSLMTYQNALRTSPKRMAAAHDIQSGLQSARSL
jgi:hypothetical protein